MIFITSEDEIKIDLPQQSLYFYAPWMPFHKKMLVMISKMEEKYPDMPFYAIDVDQFNSQCRRFLIDSVPTVVALQSGKEIKRINGLVLTSAFKRVYADICIS